jgi:hypothetical protein
MSAETHLRSQLIAVHAVEPAETFTKELARQAIVGSDLAMIVCARPDGWPAGKCAMFGRLYAWTYGETLAGKPLKERVANNQQTTGDTR